MRQDEVEAIRRLVDGDFLGAEELRTQLQGLRVRAEDEHSLSIELKVDPAHPLSPATLRVPVECRGTDGDGTEVQLLLHVVGGLLEELEIIRVDNARMVRRDVPPVEKVTVVES